MMIEPVKIVLAFIQVAMNISSFVFGISPHNFHFDDETNVFPPSFGIPTHQYMVIHFSIDERVLVLPQIELCRHLINDTILILEVTKDIILGEVVTTKKEPGTKSQ